MLLLELFSCRTHIGCPCKWLVTFPLLLNIHLHISHKPRQGSQFETTCILASFSGTAQFFHCFSVLQVTENWICRWIFRKLSGGAQFSVACNTKKKQWMMTIWGGPSYLHTPQWSFQQGTLTSTAFSWAEATLTLSAKNTHSLTPMPRPLMTASSFPSFTDHI